MLIYLPLEKLDMRYTSHLDRDIRTYLRDYVPYYKYLIIEPPIQNVKINNGSFLDATFTIQTKSHQINEISKLYANDTINDGDIIFTSDLWFPSLEAIAYLNYFTKKNVKVRGIVHAGSFTDTDFVRDMEVWAKGFEESIFHISDKIFLGSNFIKNDILKKRYVDSNKLVVTGLPLDFEELDKYNTSKKENWIVFNGRNVDEKQPHLFDELKKKLPQYKYYNTHQYKLSKSDYYELLSKSKIVVSFALQENFGYGIQEAVYLKNIPIVPNRLVYTEQFNRSFRYDTFDQCVDMVDYYMNNEVEVPKIPNNNHQIFKTWFND
jgi:hypothetical protein